jgi:hypothetical protein
MPRPVPSPEIAIQLSEVVGVHEQPAAAVTLALPEPPAIGCGCVEGVQVYVHAGGADGIYVPSLAIATMPAFQ